jgi:hypothetical protein
MYGFLQGAWPFGAGRSWQGGAGGRHVKAGRLGANIITNLQFTAGWTENKGLDRAMHEFATERNAQELSIRYVLGPRNQKILPLHQLPRTLQRIRIWSFRCGIREGRGQ